MPTVEQVLEGMNPELATKILDVCVKYDAYEGDLPTEDDAKVSDAKQMLSAVAQSWDSGITGNEAVKAVLDIAGVERNGDQPTAAEPTDQEPAEEGDFDINSIIPDFDDKKVKELVEIMGTLSKEQVEAIQEYEGEDGRKGILSFEWVAPAEPETPETAPPSEVGSLNDLYLSGELGHQIAKQQRLPAPPEAPGQVKPIPIEITEIGDKELMELFMTYHALDVRALYLQGLEEGRAEAAGALEDDQWGRSFEAIFEEEKGKLDSQSATAIENARSHAKQRTSHEHKVVGWRNLAINHRIEARNIGKLQKGYSMACERLSRELSRRQAAFERTK